MNRKQLGRQQLGAPVMEAFETLIDLVDQKTWPDFCREPVGYYFNKMIGGWLLRLMDNALSDSQLHALPRSQVYVIVISLLRDMFRHTSGLLRPMTSDACWVDPLFYEVANKLGLSRSAVSDDGQPYELDEMQNCGWAIRLATPFGIPAEKLFACHSAILAGVMG